MKPTSKTDTRTYRVHEIDQGELRALGCIPGVNVEPYFKGYQFGPCRVFVGFSDHGWHMSISHPTRYPLWDEIRDARYRFIPSPTATMAMVLPGGTETYVNLMHNCFHLWQVVGQRPARFMQPEVIDDGEPSSHRE